MRIGTAADLKGEGKEKRATAKLNEKKGWKCVTGRWKKPSV